jgi:hypothetical protein
VKEEGKGSPWPHQLRYSSIPAPRPSHMYAKDAKVVLHVILPQVAERPKW